MKCVFFRVTGVLVVLVVLLAGCGQQEPSAPEHPESLAPTGPLSKLYKGNAGEKLQFTSDMLDGINVALAKEGKEFRVAYAEYITSGESNEIGQIIYARDVGNKQMGSHWVPGDPNRGGRTDITYVVDQIDAMTTSGLSPVQTTTAIQQAMGTWQNVQCSTIPLTQVPDYGVDWGYVQYLLGFGGVPSWFADVTHGGWLPGAFFELLVPGGSNFVLGVTFTFIWVSGGEPTDMDNNGKDDVAFREIYYNDNFPWNIGATFDVETIALHEAGHGLSQAHFGKVFITTANGKLHFSPRAVMNAVYPGGVQQQLLGTDVGGHCSIWANWPNH